MEKLYSNMGNKLKLTGVFAILLVVTIVLGSSIFTGTAIADESGGISPWLNGSIIVIGIGIVGFAILRRGS